MSERKYKYRLFYTEPPISMDEIPDIFEFSETNFDKAYEKAKKEIQNKKEGTIILMLAQLDR